MPSIHEGAQGQLYKKRLVDEISGPTGPQGPAGAGGSQGNTGPQGITGSQGTQGSQGDTGTVGPQGITGVQGTQGNPGQTGVTGIQGITGSQGTQGSQGDTGVQGITGITGVQGIQGSQGDTGVQGAQGITGQQGIQGNQGITGIVGQTGITGVQGLVGITGAQGVQGNQGITGAQGVQGIQGNQGIQGITGAQGVQGNQGITGAQGVQGIQGNQGIQGITGAQGVQGNQGITGAQGVQGNQGITGAQGNAGVQGITGAQGAGGSQGITGALGATGQQGPTGLVGDSLAHVVQFVTGGYLYGGGKVAFANTTAGWFLGEDPAAPGIHKLHIGSSATKFLKYDGTDVTVYGTLQTGVTPNKRMVIDQTNNEMYFYGDAGAGVELLASVGIKTVGSDSVVGYFGSPTSGNAKIGVYGCTYTGLGVMGYGVSTNGNGVYGLAAGNAYGVVAGHPGTGDGAPFRIIPNANTNPPAQAAAAGSFYVDGNGNPYFNNSGNSFLRLPLINTGSYAGNSTANRAIAHGLGVVPKMIIITATNGTTGYCSIILSSGIIIALASNHLGLSVTAATSTNFYVGNDTDYLDSANGLLNYTWVAIA